MQIRSNASWAGMCAVAIAVAVALTYGHTLHAPWYLDDFRNIVTNDTVADLGLALGEVFQPRGFAYLTFALENAAFGMQVESAHVVNITIHAISAALVLLILLEFFPGRRDLAFIGAMAFLLHPVQTQAVTYIVQRMASMAGMFMLLSFYLYLQTRKLADKGVSLSAPRHATLYALALLAGLLGAYTKQTAVVLPLLLVAHEVFIARGSAWSIKRSAKYLAPFFAVTMAPALSSAMYLPQLQQSVVYVLEGSAPGEVIFQPNPEGVRLKYLLTQFKVFWIYQGLVWWPVKQVFDYSYPLVRDAMQWQIWAGLSGIAVVLGGAWAMRARWPLAAFGVFWFCVAMSVESSLIPLAAINEHRLYVAMLGPIAIALEAASRLRNARAVWVASLAVLLALGLLTFERNSHWLAPSEIWRDSYERVPNNPRTIDWLASAYIYEGRPQEALDVMQPWAAMRGSDARFSARYAKALYDLDRADEAFEHFQAATRADPLSTDYEVHKALDALSSNNALEALVNLDRALKRSPRDLRATYYMGVALEELGKPHLAARQYEAAMGIPLSKRISLFDPSRELALKNEASRRLKRLMQAAPPGIGQGGVAR